MRNLFDVIDFMSDAVDALTEDPLTETEGLDAPSDGAAFGYALRYPYAELVRAMRVQEIPGTIKEVTRKLP